MLIHAVLGLHGCIDINLAYRVIHSAQMHKIKFLPYFLFLMEENPSFYLTEVSNPNCQQRAA